MLIEQTEKLFKQIENPATMNDIYPSLKMEKSQSAKVNAIIHSKESIYDVECNLNALLLDYKQTMSLSFFTDVTLKECIRIISALMASVDDFNIARTKLKSNQILNTYYKNINFNKKKILTWFLDDMYHKCNEYKVVYNKLEIIKQT